MPRPAPPAIVHGMADTTDPWERVSDRLSALALKLKLHAQEELSDADLRSKAGFDKVRAAVDEAMSGVQAAYSDEGVRADAREAAAAFVDAIDSTIHAVQERLRTDDDVPPT